jgi:hypothetical protein
MKILDPGHQFELDLLDALGGLNDTKQILTYVKREGEGYPGNVGHYPGTTLQEVYRASIYRHKYLDNQVKDQANSNCIFHLRECIKNLETRAAHRHNRSTPKFDYAIENMICCPKCLHIGCEGNCHA